MRAFIDLLESISYDILLNQDIEERLRAFPAEDRVLIRDGLEVIFNAGPGGLSIRGWVDAMKAIHTNAGIRLPGGSMLKPSEREWKPVTVEKLRQIFRVMYDSFPHLISRAYADNYVWSVPDQTKDMLDRYRF